MLDAFGVDEIGFSLSFIFLSFAYIIGELIQQRRSSILSDTLITVGSLWFVGMVHFVFVSIGFDIFKLINMVTHWINPIGMHELAYHTTWATLIATVIFLCAGYINARTPAVRRHPLSIKKKNPVQKHMTIAVATDIHL
jgi:hypothetical protein